MAKSLMAVNRPRMTAATITTIVESRSSVLVGQVAFWSSPTISPRKIRVLRNGFFMLRFGRRGGNRTPNQRFWRPLLYQLSYTPVGRTFFRRRRRGPVSRPQRSQVKQLKGSLLDDVGHTAGTDGATT